MLLVLLRAAWRRWRVRKASQHLTDGLMKAPAAPAAAADDGGERKVLDARFTEAVATLKKMRLHAAGKKPGWRDWLSLSGGSYLYELPWYVFIGAPGSGKTTALVNSGLSFPLAEKFGPGAIRGVGGTRNCDWWFTDEAVLIDTAGRYTTQDSHQTRGQGRVGELPRPAEEGRGRAGRSTACCSPSACRTCCSRAPSSAARTRPRSARACRSSTPSSATRLPVYVLVTKCDLLAGFNEYFADLGKEERAQVWGFTLPAEEGAQVDEKGLADAFQREFALLHERVNDAPDRAHAARARRHAARRDLRLPAAVRRHRAAARRTCSSRSSPARASRSRPGCAASTSPAARRKAARSTACWARSRAASASSARCLPPQKSSGAQLLPHLAAARRGVRRAAPGRRRRQAGAPPPCAARGRLAAMTLVTLAPARRLGLELLAATSNYLKAVDARIAPARQQLAALPARVQNLVEVAPVLQGLRNIWKAPENREGDAPLSMTLGLYQGDKLDAAAMLAHQRVLDEVFLPQLAKRIEEQLRTAQKDNLELTYEALKAYLMLHKPEHFDAEALKAWVTLDWARNLDRGIPEDQRKLLEDQLDVLIAQGPPRSPLKMDETLVRNVRAMLASYPLEQRIFSRLKRQRLGKDIPPFSVAAAAGPAGPLVFERASGKPLTEGVPGLFTYDGYHKRFQNEVTVVTGLLAAEEPWVLGQERGAADRLRDAAALGALTDRVRRLYLEEYVKVWEALLADVRLVRATGLDKNIETARILSGAGSPLASFLRAVVKETTLTPAEQQGKDVVTKASETVRNTRKGLEELFGGDPNKPVAAGKRIESIVDDRFADAAPPGQLAHAGRPGADRRRAQAVQRGLRVADGGRHRGQEPQPRRRPATSRASSSPMPAACPSRCARWSRT